MKLAVSFVEFHNPLFMQGVNLGNKIVAKNRNAELEFDTETKLLSIDFKDKLAIVPDSNIISMDIVDPAQYWGADKPVKKTRVAKPEEAPAVTNPVQEQLIAKAQGAVAAMKAQVSNPTKPTEGRTGIQGAPKYMSHEQLAAKVAREKE